MPSDALELIGVSKVYEVGGAELVALDQVDLDVAADEVVTLLGPSGSGKTTLLSIAGGLLSTTTGRVVVAGEDITRLSARRLTSFRRERVGFIFQAVNLVPFLTARENLLVVAELARRRRGEAKRRADRLLEELGLGGRLNNLPSQLSGGERQRVAIGRALMNAPELVLIDEPTSALDSDLGQQVMELIVSEVKNRGAAAIVVTHDARMTRYGDRILNMADGRIVGGVSREEWTRNRPEPVPVREEAVPEAARLRMPVTQRQAERRAAAAALVAPASAPAPAARHSAGVAPEFGGRGAGFAGHGAGLRDVSRPEVPALPRPEPEPVDPYDPHEPLAPAARVDSPSGEWGTDSSLSGEWPSSARQGGETVTDDSLSGEWPPPGGRYADEGWHEPLEADEGWPGPREVDEMPLRRMGRRKRPGDRGPAPAPASAPSHGPGTVGRQAPPEPPRPSRRDTAEVRRAVTEWDDATGAPVPAPPEREAVDWEDLVEEETPSLWRPGTEPGAPDPDDEPGPGAHEPGWDHFAEERARSYRQPAHGDPGEPIPAASAGVGADLDDVDDEPLPDLWRPTAGESRPSAGAGRPGPRRPGPAGADRPAFRHGGPLPGGPPPGPEDDQADAAAGPWPSGSWPIVPTVATTGRGPGGPGGPGRRADVPAARGPDVPDWDSLAEGEPEPEAWMPDTPARPVPPSQQQRPVTMTTPMQMPVQDVAPSIWPRPQRPPRPGMPLTGEVDVVLTGEVPATGAPGAPAAPGSRRQPAGGSTLGRPGGPVPPPARRTPPAGTPRPGAPGGSAGRRATPPGGVRPGLPAAGGPGGPGGPGAPAGRRNTPPGGARSVPSAPGGFGGRRHTPPHGTPAVPGGPDGPGGTGGLGGRGRPPAEDEFGAAGLELPPRRPVDPTTTGSHQLLPPRRPPTSTGPLPNVHQPLLPGVPGPPPSVPTGQTPRVPGLPGLPSGRTTSSNPAIPPLVPGLPPAGGRASRHDQPTGGHRPLPSAPERSGLPALPAPAERRPTRPNPARPPAPAAPPPVALGPPAGVRRVRPEDQGRTPGPFSQQFPVVEDTPPADHPLGPRDFPAGGGGGRGGRGGRDAGGGRADLGLGRGPGPDADDDVAFDELFGKAREKERDRDARRGKPKKKAPRRPPGDRDRDRSDGGPSLGTRPEMTSPGTGAVPPLVPGLPPAGGRASRHDDAGTSPRPPSGPGPIPRSDRPSRRERRLPPEGPELRPAPPDRPSLPPPESLRHEQTADGWPAELEWQPPAWQQGDPPPESDDGWGDDHR